VTRAPLVRPTDAPPTAHEPGPVEAIERIDGPTLDDTLASELPRHVAIIMDGNRRWARARGLAELEGHPAGVEAIRGILRHARRRGLRLVGTLFVAGVVLFSGSLYALALSGARLWGAVTPLGGACFLAGWLVLAWAFRKG